jgi:zinc carboxypeptidase
MFQPLLLLALAAGAPLTTVSEQSGFKVTGRYDEVQRLCPAFEAAYRGHVKCFTFGTTPEGRPMLALAASLDGVLEPSAAKAKHRPVVLVQGGIHAGEIDGKDAGFWLLRDLLDRKAGVEGGKSVLQSVTLVFVPVFNIDGHERFGPNNRPNQVGPEEMGYRVTAQNLNLNRDYVKADAPEMRAMLALLNRYDPIVYEDLHVTDGAQFRHDISVLVEPYRAGREVLRREAAPFNDALQQGLTALGHLPVDFYPSFAKEDDPTSGFRAGISPPRFSQSYWAVRNRFGVLVETHSWKDYATRVKATRDTVLLTLQHVAAHGAAMLAAAKAADEADARGEGPVELAYTVGGTPKTFDFQGYEYVVGKSEVSGAPWIRYDQAKPQVWKVPLYTEVTPALSVTLGPSAGYLVPAGVAAAVQERLAAHGLKFTRLEKALHGVKLSAFRATSVKYGTGTFEGRSMPKVTGAWAEETRDLPPGTLFVPASQPGRALVAHLLEPSGPDSLLSWGFFNAWLERKDGMEHYVVEAEARKMLAADPKLRADFEAALKANAGFAAGTDQRLEFFERRHPSWDEHSNLYPVFRVEAPPAG